MRKVLKTGNPLTIPVTHLSELKSLQQGYLFYLLLRVFCYKSLHWLVCLLSFSQPRTQFSTLEERCHSPFHRPPRAWPLNLKEIQLHKNSFSFYGEGKRIQKDFLIPRGAQPPINQLVMKVSFPTRRRQRENRTHQVLNPPRLNACKNFYEGRDGVS